MRRVLIHINISGLIIVNSLIFTCNALYKSRETANSFESNPSLELVVEKPVPGGLST